MNPNLVAEGTAPLVQPPQEPSSASPAPVNGQAQDRGRFGSILNKIGIEVRPPVSPAGASQQGNSEVQPQQTLVVSEGFHGKIDGGNTQKMEALNYGRQNSQGMFEKVAEKFKLREGIQGNKLIFTVDKNGRFTTFDNPQTISDMPEEELAKTLVFYKTPEGKLTAATGWGNAQDIDLDALRKEPYKFLMDPTTGAGLELVGFDPTGDADLIVVNTYKQEPATVPIPVTPGLKQRFIDIIGPVVVGTGMVFGGNQATPEAKVTFVPQPPAQTVEVSTPPQPFESIDRPVSEQTKPAEINDSLKCEKFVPMTVQEGDSLTKLIVDANRVDRYMQKGTDGKFRFDVDMLYKDLMCMVVQPENMAQLQKDDPEAASLITAMFEMQKTIGGEITSQQLYDAFKDKLNTPERMEKANNQLVWTFPGSSYMVPVREGGITIQQGTFENPIPPAAGNANLASDTGAPLSSR